MSKIIKRSVVIDGRKTSISLEDKFWEGLRDIAFADGMYINELVSKIASKNRMRNSEGNLSSELRLYVLKRALGKE